MPPAIRLERAARDLYGLDPIGLPDTRPWLDHGANPTGYPFLPVEGEGLHQIPVGPVHAGIIEPGHFRFTADGETVVRLEQRLGYVHKGIDHLLHGATLEQAARLAGRTSGDSTVAYAFAFARAVESGAGHRAAAARGLAARRDGGAGADRQSPRRFRRDLQRRVVQHHAGALRHAARARAALRRRLLRPSADDGLHRARRRRGRSCGRTTSIRSLIDEIRARFPALVELYDKTASLQDRTVGTGILSAELARRFGAGGYVGRASGRDFDARRSIGYPPYDRLQFDVPVRSEGDVNARVWIRIKEIEQSLSLIEQMLNDLPGGDVRIAGCAAQAGRRHRAGRGVSRRRAGVAAARLRRVASIAAICAMHRGSSGRCWKQRSRATSSPTSRSATSRSTVPIRGTTCDRSLTVIAGPGPAIRVWLACVRQRRAWRAPMLRTLLQGLRSPVTEPVRPIRRSPRSPPTSIARRRRRLGRSLAIREVDAGSCNGCELEIHALNNAFYDLERFGLRFVASPRHADVLLVTGPVTRNMREGLERTWRATPDPKWVVAVGDCAAGCGVFADSPACIGAVAQRGAGGPGDPRLPADADAVVAGTAGAAQRSLNSTPPFALLSRELSTISTSTASAVTPKFFTTASVMSLISARF